MKREARPESEGLEYQHDADDDGNDADYLRKGRGHRYEVDEVEKEAEENKVYEEGGHLGSVLGVASSSAAVSSIACSMVLGWSGSSSTFSGAVSM